MTTYINEWFVNEDVTPYGTDGTCVFRFVENYKDKNVYALSSIALPTLEGLEITRPTCPTCHRTLSGDLEITRPTCPTCLYSEGEYI